MLQAAEPQILTLEPADLLSKPLLPAILLFPLEFYFLIFFLEGVELIRLIHLKFMHAEHALCH